jgi:hypothetical protein
MSSEEITPVDVPEAKVSNDVTFYNEVDEEQKGPINRRTSNDLASAKKRVSLSQSAKAWDLDGELRELTLFYHISKSKASLRVYLFASGDGELDEAELALRKLDKSHKGTLSKEQMYELMSENLQTQRDLFKTKKVVYG